MVETLATFCSGLWRPCNHSSELSLSGVRKPECLQAPCWLSLVKDCSAGVLLPAGKAGCGSLGGSQETEMAFADCHSENAKGWGKWVRQCHSLLLFSRGPRRRRTDGNHPAL